MIECLVVFDNLINFSVVFLLFCQIERILINIQSFLELLFYKMNIPLFFIFSHRFNNLFEGLEIQVILFRFIHPIYLVFVNFCKVLLEQEREGALVTMIPNVVDRAYFMEHSATLFQGNEFIRLQVDKLKNDKPHVKWGLLDIILLRISKQKNVFEIGFDWIHF